MTASFDFAHKNALRSGCLAINYFGGITLHPSASELHPRTSGMYARVTGLQRDVSGLYGLASALRSAETRFPGVFSRLQPSAHAFT